MSTKSEIVRLEESQIGPAAAILGRAFQNDPLMLYTIPDAAERARMLPEFYARMLRFGVLAGEVYTTAGAMEAVALWLPPGVQWTRERVQAAGLHELSSVIGADAIARFREVVGHEAVARERDMTEPYWYLLLLGVEPALQRRGLGGELIRPTIQRAHREGVAVLRGNRAAAQRRILSPPGLRADRRRTSRRYHRRPLLDLSSRSEAMKRLPAVVGPGKDRARERRP